MKLLELYISSEYSNSDEPIVINTDNIVSIKPIDVFICQLVRKKKADASVKHNNIIGALKTYSDEHYLLDDDRDVERFFFYKDNKNSFNNVVVDAMDYINNVSKNDKEKYVNRVYYLITLTNNEKYVISDYFYENNFKKKVKSIKQ